MKFRHPISSPALNKKARSAKLSALKLVRAGALSQNDLVAFLEGYDGFFPVGSFAGLAVRWRRALPRTFNVFTRRTFTLNNS